MSWDVLIMKFSRPYQSMAEIPQEEPSLPLGSRASVHERVLGQFPGANWTDPAWGIWTGPSGSIEFSIGNNDPAATMMLHVRASSEVVALIVRLCVSHGWQAIDCTSSEFLERSNDPTRGLALWKAYRDQVVGGNEP